MVLNNDLSYTLILPVSQLQIQQPMTSQIRPFVEHLIAYKFIVFLC